MISWAEIPITVEVLSALQVCNVRIVWPDVLQKSNVKITTERNLITLQINEDSELTAVCPRSVQFEAREHKFSIVDGRKLCVRVAMDAKAWLMNFICSDLASDIRSLSLKTPYDVLKGTELSVACSSCNTTLSHSVKFDRIRQMPATDWNHASEEWFCCAHGAQNEILKTGSVRPRLNDCFFSDLFFLVKHEILSDKVRYDCEGNTVCRGCEDIFGVKLESDVKLWTHRINWAETAAPTKVVYSKSEQELLVALIDHLSDDSFGANSRLVFVKPTKPKMFLYLAVIGTDLTILRSTKTSDKSEETNKRSTESENVCQGKRTRTEECKKRVKPIIIDRADAEVHLTKFNVIKISYKVVSGDCDETERWADDVNVHLLHCAESFFDAVYESITESDVETNLGTATDELFGYIHR